MTGARLLLWFLLAQTPDYLEEGRKALDANRNDEATALFQKAVDADPRDYAAHFHLALADSLLQHDPAAIAEYQKTLELKPKLYQAELNLGILFLRDKRANDAVELLRDAVLQKPAEYRPNYYLGEALLASGHPQDAEPCFVTALAAKKTAAAELGLAHALLAQSKLTESEPHFQSAAQLDPAYRDNLLELAQAQEKSGRAADAIAIYQQFPANAGAQERLGELLIESKRFAEAIPRLEKAVNDSPTPANRLALAMAYRMNKQFDKQLDQLAQATAREPDNYDLHMIYGRALNDQRQLGPASQQFLMAARIRPTSAEAWNELASAAIVHEDYAQGLAALDKVKALGAEIPGDRYLRAITLDKLHQLPGALASYKEFLATSGGKFPNQEFAARQRIRIIETELNKR